jgi:hypothetical protein
LHFPVPFEGTYHLFVAGGLSASGGATPPPILRGNLATALISAVVADNFVAGVAEFYGTASAATAATFRSVGYKIVFSFLVFSRCTRCLLFHNLDFVFSES